MNLGEVLAQLPESDRAILLLRAFADLAIHEAAATAGIDPAEADQRYAQALGQLREVWQASPAARAFWKPFRLPRAH
jgi:DNA-directed RNA polymerase specialized sigma24 family protein